jgi:molecular chaperone GrpE (heat shock protein)
VSKRIAGANVIGETGFPGHHKGWRQDSYKYPVLAVSMMDKTAKDVVEATVKTLASGEEAQAFVFGTNQDRDQKTGFQMGWMYEQLDKLGRCGVLKYRGTEVVLFYKRQLNEILPATGDPVPTNSIKEPVDVWQRFSLFGASARESNRFIKQEIKNKTETGRLLEQRVASLDNRNWYLEKKVKGLERQLASTRERLKLKKGRIANNQRRLGHHDIMEGMCIAYAEMRMAMEITVTRDWVKVEFEKSLSTMRQVAGRLKFKFICPDVSDKLNPQLHQIVGEDEKGEPGLIYRVVSAGYVELPKKLHKQAQVIVGKTKEAQEPSDE